MLQGLQIRRSELCSALYFDFFRSSVPAAAAGLGAEVMVAACLIRKATSLSKASDIKYLDGIISHT